MDKSWITIDKRTKAFMNGLEIFLTFSAKGVSNDGKIPRTHGMWEFECSHI